MHLHEETISSREIFKGKVVTLLEDEVLLENQQKATREVVKHTGGVCVLAVTPEKEIILVKQFRYGMGKIVEEIPAGKLEIGEDPLECGKRELLEETGYTAEKYTFLGEFYPTPAYCSEIIYIYMAENLTFSQQNLDKDEFLDIIKLPLNQAVKDVLSNKIADGKTQTAILKGNALLNPNRL